jgi:DNA-nicking Smr family endonuclease
MTSEHKDEDIFLQEMQGVKPLQVEKKVSIKRGQVSEMSLEAKREAATAEAHVDNNHLASDFVELLDPFYPLSFKRPGVQHGVFKKLKQGRYKSEARLDLHRMTADQARKQVFEFIKESYSYDLRSLLLIPGKGSHNQANESLLKSYINR